MYWKKKLLNVNRIVCMAVWRARELSCSGVLLFKAQGAQKRREK